MPRSAAAIRVRGTLLLTGPKLPDSQCFRMALWQASVLSLLSWLAIRKGSMRNALTATFRSARCVAYMAISSGSPPSGSRPRLRHQASKPRQAERYTRPAQAIASANAV